MTAEDRVSDDRFRLARLALGLSQGALAETAGVTRQAISGIESGRWSPSLDVAIALAAALSSTVEELFGGPPTFPPATGRLVADLAEPPPGGSLRFSLAEVAGSGVLFPLTADRSFAAGFRPATAASHGGPAPAGSSLEAGRLVADATTVAVSGCDPALALLSGPLGRHRPPAGLVWWSCGNGAAAELLAAGSVHAAALHRRADRRAARPAGVEVVGFAGWREGLVVAAELADKVADLADAVALGLRLANREPGSEARRLLDERLRGLAVDPAAVPGYDTSCSAHLLVASAIAAGLADFGVASEPAALAYGLGFVAWQDEVSELHVLRSEIATPAVKALLDVLAGPELPAQLGAISGYDPSPCGKVAAA